MKLTETQKKTLVFYSKKDQRCIYGTRGDPCLNALGRKGLTHWYSNIGHKYGKAHWWITDKGMIEAKKLLNAID